MTQAARAEEVPPPRHRKLAALVYWGIARQLPWSPRPGGTFAKAIRGFLAARMLDSCGKAVNIEHGAWFGSGRGVRVGDRSAIGLDALILGPVVIGADVIMGPRCILLSNRHDVTRHDVPINAQGYLPPLPIVIEDDVFVGAGVTVLAGVRIGTNSVVGAGSVVVRDVPPGSVVAGNPAIVVRKRT